jgi:dihydrofolate reductase
MAAPTRKLIYSFAVSLDGYIADAAGNFDWAAPDEELHRFHNERAGEVDVYLLGRRLYETMVYWETAEEEHPDSPEHELEFARIWGASEKVVFSRTLERVAGNARLSDDDPTAALARLKSEPGKDIALGGAGLASSLIERDLVDEYRLFFNPVIVGGGTPYFPPFQRQLDLRLAETRTFGSRVVYLRYERHPAHP